MDLSNPQSLNRYAYVLNDPMNAVDPDGLEGARPFLQFPTGGGSCSLNGVQLFDCGGIALLLESGAAFDLNTVCPQCQAGDKILIGQDYTVYRWVSPQFGVNPSTGNLFVTNGGWQNVGTGAMFAWDDMNYQAFGISPPMQLIDAGAGPTGTITAGPPGAKEAFCHAQANAAFKAKVVPGGEHIFKGDLTAQSAAVAGIDIGKDIAFDQAKDAGKMWFLGFLKSKGVSGAVRARVSLGLRGIGYAGLAITAYRGLTASQDVYADCIQ